MDSRPEQVNWSNIIQLDEKHENENEEKVKGKLFYFTKK